MSFRMPRVMLPLTLLLSFGLVLADGHRRIADDANSIEPAAVGDKAPSFTVRAVDGSDVHFDPDAMQRPTILITFRGGWCPYCNLHLSELRHVLPEIESRDIDVLFLSGDRPDQLIASLEPETQENVEGLGYTLLSDANADAATALGIAFRVPDKMAKFLEDRGNDIEGSSIDNDRVLPVPAVYAIDRDGMITYAYTNADYKVRLSADELLEVADAL